MTPDYGETIYEILSKIVGLKFKSQIKNSGIEFKKIFKITDLETNKDFYSLIINQEQINFKDKTEFLNKFAILLEENMKEFDKRFEELQKISNNRWIDENQIFMEHEEIGHYGYKQSKLLQKIREFKNNVG